MKFPILILIVGLVVALFGRANSPSEPQRTIRHSPPVTRNETVILLHGLCRSSRSMDKMATALKADGYDVINVNYPSRSATIEELTDEVFQALEKNFPTIGKINFVTHSMGGILLKNYLQDHEIPTLGKTVMLAPPTRGSEVPDKLGGLKLYQWINGPAGNQLGTGTDSLPLRLKEPEMELGVIAGDRRFPAHPRVTSSQPGRGGPEGIP